MVVIPNQQITRSKLFYSVNKHNIEVVITPPVKRQPSHRFMTTSKRLSFLQIAFFLYNFVPD